MRQFPTHVVYQNFICIVRLNNEYISLKLFVNLIEYLNLFCRSIDALPNTRLILMQFQALLYEKALKIVGKWFSIDIIDF